MTCQSAGLQPKRAAPRGCLRDAGGAHQRSQPADRGGRVARTAAPGAPSRRRSRRGAGRPGAQPAPQSAFLSGPTGSPADSLRPGATAAGVNTQGPRSPTQTGRVPPADRRAPGASKRPRPPEDAAPRTRHCGARRRAPPASGLCPSRRPPAPTHRPARRRLGSRDARPPR